MLIGYARVSTAEQRLDLQVDALTAAGCDRLFEDVTSGASSDKPQLEAALSHLREGDTLVVWRLDRLGRSLKQLIELTGDLSARGVEFRSLVEAIDTSTTMGRFFFHVVGAFAEMERHLIRDRTMAGLAAARARGRVGGRPKAIDDRTFKAALALYDAEELSVREICERLGISERSFYRYRKAHIEDGT